VIDGHVLRRLGARREFERALGDRQLGVRRDHVHVVRRDPDVVAGLDDGHRGRAPENLAQAAGMAGIEVLDEHEGVTGVGRDVAQQPVEGVEPTCGRADTDDGAPG
jgi:hypothetical protein